MSASVGDHESGRCGLCRSPLEVTGDRRIAGLDLCERCWGGDLEDRLEARSFRFVLRRWTETISTDHHGRPIEKYFHEVYCTLDRSICFRASFSREGLGSKVRKLFSSELQAGDALFDDSVFVETSDHEIVKKLLSSSGFQSAVMEVIALPAGRLDIIDDEVWFRHGKPMTDDDYEGDEAAAYARSVAVVAHYVTTILASSSEPEVG